MAPDAPIYIQLDRKREIRWTKRAELRNASLPRPVWFNEITRRRNAAYVIAALIWSALVDRDHGFDAPEDLADYLTSEDQQVTAVRAIFTMAEQAFPQKKTSGDSGSSVSGPGPSSNADSVPQPSIGGA